jgi:hypothetical protein
MWKEPAVVYFKLLQQHFHVETEEDYDTPQFG